MKFFFSFDTRILLLLLLYLIPEFLLGQCVTSRIHAQLGNQMFQVAASIAYGLDHGCAVQFPELTSYPEVFHRINRASFPSSTQFFTYEEPFIHTQQIPCYHPLPYRKAINLRLDGYFQSEKYFFHHKSMILYLFSPSTQIVEELSNRYGHLLAQNTVAIHIRTFIPDGNNPEDPHNWGCFNWEYFQKAMEFFPEDYLFLVFSDTIEWVKKHFPQTNKRYIFIEDNPPHLDLYLISLCQHQIVSPRSSFSWWGAYLNQNADKIIIAPKEWGLNQDGIPDSWIRL